MGQRIPRIILVFISTVIATTILACVIGTQFVLAGLSDVGIAIPLAVRIANTWYDIINLGFIPSPAFGFSYGLMITIGLFIAFIAAAAVAHFLPRYRVIIFTVAGAVAIITQLWVSFQSFEVMLFAFARTPLGLGAQAIAGAVGGWMFATYTAQGEGTKKSAGENT